MKDYPSEFDEEEVPDEASSHSINDSEVDFENLSQGENRQTIMLNTISDKIEKKKVEKRMTMVIKTNNLASLAK